MPNPGLLQSLAQTSPAAGINQGLQGLSSNFQNQIQMGLMVQDKQIKQKQMEAQQKQQKMDSALKMFGVATEYSKLGKSNPYFKEMSAKVTKEAMITWAEVNGHDTTELKNIDISMLLKTPSLDEFNKKTAATIKAYKEGKISLDELNQAKTNAITGLNTDYDVTADSTKSLGEQFSSAVEKKKNADLANTITRFNTAQTQEDQSLALQEVLEIDVPTGTALKKEYDALNKLKKTPQYVETIENGMFGKKDAISGVFYPVRKATQKDIKDIITGPESPGDKTGQNWVLTNGSTVISYDGGRTYSSNGKSLSIPSSAIKVPGGATLNEVRMQDAKAEALADLEISTPGTLSPKENVLSGTGPYKRIASVFEAVAGGFGLDALIGMQGFFPKIADAKQFLRSVKQMGKTALMNSSRGAIWEQQKIDTLFPDPDKTFTNPRIEARKFGNLLEVLNTEKRFNNQAIVSAINPKEVDKYRTSNNEINRLIAFISEPKVSGITNTELSGSDKELVDKYLKGK